MKGCRSPVLGGWITPFIMGFLLCMSIPLASAKVRRYRWEVTYELKSPDCVEKLVIAINGRTPGPIIMAQQGDTVIVEVMNGLLTENTAIHWHGIRQIGTPWSDGTEGVTQCPILPGETFVYKFVVDRPGTYIYHAHYGMQRSAGLYGSIHVSLPDGVSEPFTYDYDRNIVLNDWWHKTTHEQAAGLSSIPFVWVKEPQSLLINGRGWFNCSSAGNAVCNATNPQCSPFVLTVVPGKTYRLRISSLASLSAFNFEIEGHNMTVVETDGHYVEPFVVKNLNIYSGETYSVLVVADQDPSRNYWAALNVVSRNANGLTGLSIFNYYPNHPRRRPPTTPPAGPLWNDTEYRLNQSLKIRARRGYVYPPPATADRLITLLNTQNKIDGHTRWAVNNISFTLPHTPYLIALKHKLHHTFSQSVPPETYDRANYDIFKQAANPNATYSDAVYRLKFNSTVDIILQNANTMVPNEPPPDIIRRRRLTATPPHRLQEEGRMGRKEMDSSWQNSYGNSQSLYPEVIQTNPELHSPFVSSAADGARGGALYPSLDGPTSVPAATAAASSGSSSLYPSVDMKDLVENLFPDAEEEVASAPGNPNLGHPPVEETLVRVPGAILHLIDRQRSLDLGSGDFSVVRLQQGDNVIAVLARVGDVVQWPLAKDEAAVRLDHSRYFFSLRVPEGSSDAGEEDARHSGDGSDSLLNYGLTFASKGQEALLEALDGILAYYTNFSLQKVETRAEVLDESVPKETSPAEVATSGPKREKIEKLSAAYWTTLAPNVEDYSGSVPRAIARGSGHLIRGILWCGDVTVDRLNRGNDVLKSRMSPNAKPTEISEQALRRMKRVKRVTKMSEKVANGVLSGALKVSGFFTSSVVNSRAGKKFFSLLPGEIVLASLDGFARVGDAVEAVGKNVLSTSSTVTTEVVSHKYGEEAAKLTNEGLHATGHAMGTAWAVFKLRKALNPKNSIKPSSIVKSAMKAASSKSKAK